MRIARPLLPGRGRVELRRPPAVPAFRRRPGEGELAAQQLRRQRGRGVREGPGVDDAGAGLVGHEAVVADRVALEAPLAGAVLVDGGTAAEPQPVADLVQDDRGEIDPPGGRLPGAEIPMILRAVEDGLDVRLPRIEIAPGQLVGERRRVPGILLRCAGEVAEKADRHCAAEQILRQWFPRGGDRDRHGRRQLRLPDVDRVLEGGLRLRREAVVVDRDRRGLGQELCRWRRGRDLGREGRSLVAVPSAEIARRAAGPFGGRGGRRDGTGWPRCDEQREQDGETEPATRAAGGPGPQFPGRAAHALSSAVVDSRTTRTPSASVTASR